MEAAPGIEWVTIKTTLPAYPLPSNDERELVMTNRLILRPFKDDSDDLKAVHAVRANSEVMHWSAQGRPDKDMDETYNNCFKHLLSPNDTKAFMWAICLVESGEMIGLGGNASASGWQGWPEIGYRLNRKAWGKGYATEFVGAFLDLWWALPRQEVTIQVDKNTVYGVEDIKDECISAHVLGDNQAGQGVLQKQSFERVTVWQDKDFRDCTKTVTLYGWVRRSSTA